MRYTAPLTAAQAEQLGNDVGVIIGFAANAISHLRGDTITEQLMRTLASSAAIDVTAARYLKALEEGHRPGDAAAKAGTALIHDWANAVLETRDRLNQQHTGQDKEAAQ
ncbi:hypothetical protein [Streptomyces alanosinicus]|uniref:Uncharacterized protein n=1 Tax=Streptomyces alanosinicus TaxID=68171 RepID=A0A918YQC6_9ACTN|nr:hypothetical protein [Streptomyces alanosinicus]GHE11459.1 hypothetical protein GCM10010339_71410 [Streptomyces alanosinicus]